MFLDPVFHWGRPRTPAAAVVEPARRRPPGGRRGFPPWWHLPHLAASQALFLWFCAMLSAPRAARLRGGDGAAGDRSGALAVLLAVRLISVGILPQALQRPDSTHLAVGDVCVLAVRRRRRSPRSSPAGGRGSTSASPRRRLAASASPLTFAFTALFTFRYYLLHTRVGLGPGAEPVPVGRDDRYFYLGDYAAYLAMQAAVDDSTVGRARRAAARRSARPPPHVVQRRRSSTGCSPSSSRPRTSSRWIPASPTTPGSGWRPTSRPPTGSSSAGFWDGWSSPTRRSSTARDAPTR